VHPTHAVPTGEDNVIRKTFNCFVLLAVPVSTCEPESISLGGNDHHTKPSAGGHAIRRSGDLLRSRDTERSSLFVTLIGIPLFNFNSRQMFHKARVRRGRRAESRGWNPDIEIQPQNCTMVSERILNGRTAWRGLSACLRNVTQWS